MTKNDMSPALKYFFKKLERKSEEVRQIHLLEVDEKHEVPFEEVERFARAIMTQNIFIFTVGVNGKRESTILTKAMFSINKVVRLYYSTSFDETQQGFIRLRPDTEQQLILVERLHGLRPRPELLYASKDECHVVRFFTNWLLRRIDWEKTKINNLDLYKRFVDLERKALEEAIAAEEAEREHHELQKTLSKHFGDNSKHKMPTKLVQ
ncbi:MAG: hypothetical protein ACP5D0_02225 [Hydrogenovibrio sp.]